MPALVMPPSECGGAEDVDGGDRAAAVGGDPALAVDVDAAGDDGGRAAVDDAAGPDRAGALDRAAKRRRADPQGR